MDKSYNLLHIESNTWVRGLVKQLLGNRFKIDSATDGRQAMTFLKDQLDKYDVIITEMQVKYQTGEEIIHFMLDRGRSVDSIIVTTDFIYERVDPKLYIPRRNYFRKPLDVKCLVVRANEICGNTGNLQAARDGSDRVPTDRVRDPRSYRSTFDFFDSGSPGRKILDDFDLVDSGVLDVGFPGMIYTREGNAPEVSGSPVAIRASSAKVEQQEVRDKGSQMLTIDTLGSDLSRRPLAIAPTRAVTSGSIGRSIPDVAPDISSKKSPPRQLGLEGNPGRWW